jgi:hypothetical protein
MTPDNSCSRSTLPTTSLELHKYLRSYLLVIIRILDRYLHMLVVYHGSNFVLSYSQVRFPSHTSSTATHGEENLWSLP